MSHPGHDDIVRRIFSYSTRGIKYDLTRMKEAVTRLGNPQESFRSIHVAGTNGKGSTCAYLESILRRTGARTGLYTSPHILAFEERFIIGGTPVTADEWMELFPLVEPMISDLELTFFEIATLICFELFKRRGVQWAVVEAGMGGRLDATNVLRPALSLITTVDMDHMEYLGADLASITGEKLGIVKPDTPLVMVRPSSPAIQRRVREVCRDHGAPLAFVDRDCIGETRVVHGHSLFEYDGMRIAAPLAGRHQELNIACALRACEILEIGTRSDRGRGVEETRLPGRFQLVERGGKSVVFDVAHNPGAARALAETLQGRFAGVAVRFVTGIMKDKDISGVFEALASVGSQFILTQPKTERACTADRLAAHLPSPHPPYTVVPDVANAVDVALAGPDPVVCITGSFYTVGEAMRHLGVKPYDAQGS